MKYIIYDFETSGRSARFDQILQAGIIVYDNNFFCLDKLNVKSRLNSDIIPSFGALKVNKLKIKDLLSEEKTYYDMILVIDKFLTRFEQSFFLGFNSIHFDEEFFRQALWEHFIFPYKTNTQGNRRGDVMNLVTMVHAFRKNNIKVKKNEKGKFTFKLESLAEENSFKNLNSHEAIADVEATMKLMLLLYKKNKDFFNLFVQNSETRNVEKKITEQRLFTYHNYLFNTHRIYLVKFLIRHPVYKNQMIGFDLKYDCSQIVNYTLSELKEIYRAKSFFRKIKINKQPTILHEIYGRKVEPYNNFSEEEIQLKIKQLQNPVFLNNLKTLLELESIDKIEEGSQVQRFEEETIYSQNLSYSDSSIMKKFHTENWDKKWKFAEKFVDSRLRFFAAKHIYRNCPSELPKKIFLRLHQKISERINSCNKESFMTLQEAYEESKKNTMDSKNENFKEDIRIQLYEYNIYINFLNDYYSNPNPKPLKFDKTLSKELFG